MSARWRERHLEGRTIKTAWIVCEGHEVDKQTKNGRQMRRRVHVDALRITFTDGSKLEMIAELPTWGFNGPPSAPTHTDKEAPGDR